MSQSFYEFEAVQNDGKVLSMSEFKGKVVLVVNVASKCGHTKQYAGLEELWKKYKDQGLVILGFPCNQFGGQEPGNDEQIREFCTLNYGVTFPLFSKIKVNGPDAIPLYPYLKEQAPGEEGRKPIKWNFTKFLINRDGTVLKRFFSKQKPAEIESEVAALL